MKRLILALSLSTALSTPGFAQDMPQDIACSTFMAMSHDDQMAAMSDAMAVDMKMPEDAMAADGAMATDDAMAADSAMVTDDAMAADDTTVTGDAMASDGAMASDDAMAALVATCTANPDMMIMDAMHSMN
jgi:hypothetical protein